jgi:hypothetical protein
MRDAASPWVHADSWIQPLLDYPYGVSELIIEECVEKRGGHTTRGEQSKEASNNSLTLDNRG